MLNFIPVLSAGRSGTNKLAKLFETVADVYSEHEGDPGFHTVRLLEPHIQNKFIADKVEYYYSTNKCTIVHTGHIMGLGFLDKMISHMRVADCIVLERPWRDIAKSMFLLDWIPYRQKILTPWYTGPNEGSVLPYPGYEQAHSYQLCFWWCLESDRRIKQQVKALSTLGINIHYTSIKKLIDDNNFNELLTNLNLPQVYAVDKSLVNDQLSLPHLVERHLPPDDFLDHLEKDVYARTSYLVD